MRTLLLAVALSAQCLAADAEKPAASPARCPKGTHRFHGKCVKNAPRADAAYSASSGPSATVSPAALAVKRGESVDFTVSCSAGEPVVGFSPPVGSLRARGWGNFTLHAEADAMPGPRTGAIRCGGKSVSATISLTVNP